jgi:hypothetical protein
VGRGRGRRQGNRATGTVAPQPRLFPSLIEPYRHKKNKRRIGNARLDKTIIKDLAKFVLWVNTQCRHQRGQQGSVRRLSEQSLQRGALVLAWKHGLRFPHTEQIADGGVQQAWKNTRLPSRAVMRRRPHPLRVPAGRDSSSNYRVVRDSSERLWGWKGMELTPGFNI